MSAKIVYPNALKESYIHKEHGLDRGDPYYWMRNREDPRVISYLQAENFYTEQKLSHLKEPQERIYEEMLARIQEADTSSPYFDAPYWYYSRTEKGKAYRIYCRRYQTLGAPEEIFLDLNELAKDREYLGCH